MNGMADSPYSASDAAAEQYQYWQLEKGVLHPYPVLVRVSCVALGDICAGFILPP